LQKCSFFWYDAYKGGGVVFDIESIQALYSSKAVEYTHHFKTRMRERGFSFKDIRAAMSNGEIIAQNLADSPNPSVLVLGYTENDTPIHIAVGVGDDKLYLATAYFPTIAIWNADFKTKKEGD
jgi:uncharacterized DUF497 family protein